ncbi:MAG: VWA domain-containing protein [Deltaproteobacteria bacterium]|nr:MAG: VWA domain-containing protein [Deltaproteobacteria bacterium]
MKTKLTTLLIAASLMSQSVACMAIEKPNTFQNVGGIKIKGSLSQTKVLQGSDGLIYLQLDMEAPERSGRSERKPTDFVIVLDRSGSMADEKKMDYAHRAIDSLINQLQPTDRLGLVAFDSVIETPIHMSYASSGNKSRFHQIVNGIEPRGGTNLGGGLIQGITQIHESGNGRAQRMILISDGLANEGITDESELRRIAGDATQSFSKSALSISTVGVGIDFNEHLMASVADHGHGNYYYLEKLAMLDKVLSDEFTRASQIAASDVRVNLELSDGFTLTDASGYPYHQEGRRIIVEPGHLYSGQKKSFF